MHEASGITYGSSEPTSQEPLERTKHKERDEVLIPWHFRVVRSNCCDWVGNPDTRSW